MPNKNERRVMQRFGRYEYRPVLLNPDHLVPLHWIPTHQGRAAANRRSHAVVDRSTVRPLPRVRDTLPLPDALSRMRSSNSHLVLVTSAHGDVVAMVALEDLFEDLVGTVRDGTHCV